MRIGRGTITATALIGVVMSSGTVVAQAVAQGSSRAMVTVFVDANYRGASVALRGATPDLKRYGIDNMISSLRMAPGQSWEVCERPNFGGRCQVVTGDVRDFGKTTSWNDRISSLRPVQRAVSGGNVGGVRQLILYSQFNFTGSSYPVTGPMAQTGTVVTRSARVQGAWQVCDGRQFTGTCRVITGNVPDVRTLGLSRIQSARPR